jgi:transcriptional regulator with XRE-family HTH domain
MTDFGLRTAELRKMLGLTQKEFSDAGNLSQSNLSYAEAGKSFPTVGFLLQIKKTFPAINMNWWLSGEGPMFMQDDLEEAVMKSQLDPALKLFLSNLNEEINKISMSRGILKLRKG